MNQDASVSALLDAIDVPDQRGKLPAKPVHNAPIYYLTHNGTKDTYDLLAEVFGEEALKAHMLMEAMQYLIRCRKKGSMAQDLEKVLGICRRLIAIGEGGTS